MELQHIYTKSEDKTNQSNSKFIGSFVNFYYMATVLFGAAMFCHYQQASLCGTGQQSAGVLAPTPLFNCLPQAALTQEWEVEKEQNKVITVWENVED